MSLLLFLLLGALIGWYYDRTITGLLIASLLGLAWQTRQLLQFERALRTDNFDKFRYGEGIWEQLFSRVRFDRERGRRRKEAYRNLLKEVRKSTDAMPDGAIILNSRNEIVACNRAASVLGGLKRKKDRGQRLDNILRDQSISALINASNFDQSIEVASPVRDGDWLNCRVVPYGVDQKLFLLRDVTERVRLGKMRRDFVANASHELRSPLTVIGGYLEALSDDDELPPQWEKPVQQMRSQSERMQQILAVLMELSRLENATSASHEEAIDVGSLINKVLTSLPRQPGQADISTKVTCSTQLLGREAEIESVLVNLLANALRYTSADGSINVSWTHDTDGASLVVEDTGIGIEAEHLHRLTERFFRVDRGRSRDDGGVGLGLAIVKHVLVRHDAELDIRSEPGSGSCFRCVFPASRLDKSVS